LPQGERLIGSIIQVLNDGKKIFFEIVLEIEYFVVISLSFCGATIGAVDVFKIDYLLP
jgi:hypothetical protein